MSRFYSTLFLNRTLCDILEEMRKLDATKNYSALLGLIEEAQSAGNKMESKLSDIKDLATVREDAKEVEKQIKELKKELEVLKEKKSV